jgi:LCP family protein required for cell wall assembly
MFRGRSNGSAPLWGYASKVGYLVCCIASAVILVVGGVAHKWYQDLNEVGGSNVLDGQAEPQVGEMNILLMGLESRTYWDGQILPENILNAMHACSQQGVENGCGGNDTNTLILLHIPAGGGKAVGFSIPRDDYVEYPQAYDGQSSGKIDQAYGLAMAEEENKLLAADGGKLTSQIAFQGNEAGRAAAVATVEQVTGQKINHFAEVNLVGFYELAQVFGGVDVCLNHPVAYDSYSGFYAHRAGLQHLNAAMTLAFVRQRHGLTNGDLDRTHRQQAVIDSVIHQMKQQGILSDFGKLGQLLDVAKQWVVTDSDWKLLDFASQMRSLTAGNMSFQTLPITGYATIDGQDDNTINVPYIQQLVHDAFASADQHKTAEKAGKGGTPTTAPPAATPSTTTVNVYNGGNTAGLAASVLQALGTVGYQQGSVGNAQSRATTQVLYGPGAAGSADNIASDFNVTAQSSNKVAANEVEVVLGADATAVPSMSTPNAAASAPASSSPPATPAESNGANGGTVHAIDGTPCVD